MKKRICSRLLGFAVAVSVLMASASAAYLVPNTDWLASSVAHTDTAACEIEGETVTVYRYPAGTVLEHPFGLKLWFQDVTTGKSLGDGLELTLEDDHVYAVGYQEAAHMARQYVYVQGSGAASEEDSEPKEQPSAWAAEQVDAAIEAGIVPESLQSGYAQPTTRAEFCALATNLYETVMGHEIIERLTFTDTTDVNVEKMAAIGVVSGMGDNQFAPDEPLTREQAAAMLARLANAMGKPLTEKAPTFADNASISAWAVDAVGQVQASGVMSGVGNNTFSPRTGYTREQAIATVFRLYALVKD